MHGRLVCGESTKPPDSLQRGTRVPLRRKLGLSPLVGGAARVSEEERIQGGGEEGWQYSQALRRAECARGLHSKRDKERNKNAREEKLKGLVEAH